MGTHLAIAALATAAVATSASGDILDFESLPYPTGATSAGIVTDPFELFMGFRFTSVNFIPPTSPFENVWQYYALLDPPNYGYGYPYGINGARALSTPMWDLANPHTFSIERQDGGEWLYGGAQFSPVSLAGQDAVFRICGWRDGVEVYNIGTHLIRGQQVFVGSTLSAIVVDRVVMTYRQVPPSAVISYRFTMDDMHYQLVPAPGSLVLLSMCGLSRQRRRD